MTSRDDAGASMDTRAALPDRVTRMTVTRFAPSPTGSLHAGNIRTAIVNWLYSRSVGGRFVLRLDDTDVARSSAESALGIRDDLAWLGLTPDAEVRQSDRFALYEAALATLVAAGRAYPAYETAQELDVKRKIQLSRGLPPVYDRGALKLTAVDRAALEAKGIHPHWRFKLDTSVPIAWADKVRGACHIDPASLSDPVIRRGDGSWLYMLPSVVDDIDLGITAVVRGEDHVTNSGVQIQMFQALGAALPEFAHLALLTGADAALSKRIGSEGTGAWRAAGIEPLTVVALLARIGTSLPVEPVASLQPLIDSFDFAQFGRAAARFDPADLIALNARILHLTDYAAVASRLPAGMTEPMWNAVRPNVSTVDEAAAWLQVIEGPVDAVAEAGDAAFLDAAHTAAAGLGWDDGIWAALTGALKASTARKGKALFLPLRRALTGRDHGPEMAALLPLIGRERALERLRAASLAKSAQPS
jgi:glutamyl-tRNA synthetase